MKRLFILTAACALGAFADPLYVAVNDPNASDEACEGRGTEALPYRTIQAAVNASEADGTILVKPGVYSNGTTTVEGCGASRVVIDRRVTLLSTGGKDVTAIEGRFRSDGARSWGTGAVRAVLVTADGAGSVVRGFTLRNGATLEASGTSGSGAGFMSLANAYLADSNVTNCLGRDTGGALYGGTAIRCFFAGNVHGDLNWKGGILHRANLWYCVVDHKTASGYGCYCNCTNVNCSYFNTGTLNNDRSSRYYNCLVSSGTAGGTTTYSNCVTSVEAFFSPNDYDYETVANGTDYKKGRTADIYGVFDVPASLRGTDFAGRTIDVSGATCTVGAYDAPAAPTYGAIKCESLSFDGIRTDLVGTTFYLRSRTYPCIVTFTLDNIVGLSHGYPLGTPLMDGKTYLFALPFSPSQTLGTWHPGGQPVRYVDQATGSDETGAGTAASPYATIQKACDSVSATSYPLIKVAAGSYAPFSLKLNGGYFGRVFATNGYEKTFIVGGADTRCAAMTGGGTFILQGFTLTGANWTTKVASALTSGSVTLADCMVSNNVAAAGGSLMGSGYAIRTRFIGNETGNSIYEGSGGMAFCLFTDNVCGGSVISGAGNPSIFNCSFYGNETGGALVGYNTVYPNNCLFDANGGTFTRIADTGIATNYVYNYIEGSGSAANGKIVDRNPLFVDPANGDFRVPSTWSAATDGLFGSADARMLSFANYAQGDLNGAKIEPSADGRIALGCIQTGFEPAVVISDIASGLSITGGKVGVNSYSPENPLVLTVTVAANPGRPTRGLVVTEADGVTVTTNLFAETPVWSRTATVAADSFTLAALYDTDFYVDAVNGSDANTGFAANAAKKTLAGLFGTVPLQSGDVVHAAPGTYDEETMTDATDVGTLTRVIVPAGVTLVSTGGKDVTTIQGGGEISSGAIRCVLLGKGARLEGFTLKNGRVYRDSSTGKQDSGAGICCRSGAVGTAVDCAFTGCRAYSGSAGGCYATLIRCRADDCNHTYTGSIFYECTFVSCVINRSVGPCSTSTLYNCIVMPNYGYFALEQNSVCKAYNSLLYGPMTKAAGCEYVNCICVTNGGEFGLWGTSLRPTDALAADVRFVALSEIGYVTTRPTTALAKAQLVDRGRNGAVYPFDDDTRWDLGGLPRSMNYDIDIGAYEEEGTLRADMKAALGKRVASVGWVSSNAVVNAESRVLLDGNGATVEAVLVSREGAGTLAVPATLTGEGTLSCSVDGAVKGTLAATGTLTIPDVAYGSNVTFAYTGTGTAALGTLALRRGLLFILR